MNKLAGMRCYLCGPIDCAPDFGIGWRRDISDFLKSMKISILDPTDKPINGYMDEKEELVHIREQYKKNGQLEYVTRLVKRIRAIDLRLVDLADFLIIHLDTTIFSCGTMEELFWGNRMKKPCLTHIEQGRINTPDWLLGTLPLEHFFDTWQDLKIYLTNINNNSKIDTTRRWCFLNYNKINGVY